MEEELLEVLIGLTSAKKGGQQEQEEEEEEEGEEYPLLYHFLEEGLGSGFADNFLQWRGDGKEVSTVLRCLERGLKLGE